MQGHTQVPLDGQRGVHITTSKLLNKQMAHMLDEGRVLEVAGGQVGSYKVEVQGTRSRLCTVGVDRVDQTEGNWVVRT